MEDESVKTPAIKKYVKLADRSGMVYDIEQIPSMELSGNKVALCTKETERLNACLKSGVIVEATEDDYNNYMDELAKAGEDVATAALSEDAANKDALAKADTLNATVSASDQAEKDRLAQEATDRETAAAQAKADAIAAYPALLAAYEAKKADIEARQLAALSAVDEAKKANANKQTIKAAQVVVDGIEQEMVALIAPAIPDGYVPPADDVNANAAPNPDANANGGAPTPAAQ